VSVREVRGKNFSSASLRDVIGEECFVKIYLLQTIFVLLPECTQNMVIVSIHYPLQIKAKLISKVIQMRNKK
jgi:hypothetical protein